MLDGIWQIVLIMVFSSVKFALAFPLVYASGLSLPGMIAVTSCGGVLGIVAFTFLGAHISRLLNAVVRRAMGKRAGERRRNFTPVRRRLVRIKSHYGLAGIALLTPVLLSIPLGAFLAARYYSKRKYRMLLMMCSGVVFWSVVLSVFGNFGRQLLRYVF